MRYRKSMRTMLSLGSFLFGIFVLIGCKLSGDRGNVGPDVYAGGSCINSSDVDVPGYWKNGTWNGLPPLDVTKDAWVLSLVVDGTDVYAGGHGRNSSDVSVPGYWKNGTWNGLPPLDATKGAYVHSLVVDGTDVYAGGRSINGSDVGVPGYWKNGTWNGLPPTRCNERSTCIFSRGRWD